MAVQKLSFLFFILLLFAFILFLSTLQTLKQHEESASFAVVLCGANVRLAKQLSESVRHYSGTVQVFVGALDPNLNRVRTNTQDNFEFTCFGNTYINQVRNDQVRNKFKYKYVLFLIASPSLQIASPATLFERVAETMQRQSVDVLGISSTTTTTTTTTNNNNN